MNRDHDPCRTCARFLPTGGQKLHVDGPGHCEGFDRPAQSTDQPCVLYVERGSRTDRLSKQPVVRSKRPAPAPETISRASATDAGIPASTTVAPT